MHNRIIPRPMSHTNTVSIGILHVSLSTVTGVGAQGIAAHLTLPTYIRCLCALIHVLLALLAPPAKRTHTASHVVAAGAVKTGAGQAALRAVAEALAGTAGLAVGPQLVATVA